MDRRVLVSAIVALSFTLGCGRSASEQAPKPTEPAPPPPPAATAAAPAPTVDPSQPAGPCTVVPGRIALIKVDEAGNSTPECIEIDKKKDTTVVWVGVHPVATLRVSFKACPGSPIGNDLPDNPACTEFACALDARAYSKIAKKTDACYTVVVTVPNKPPVTKDPKLIINP